MKWFTAAEIASRLSVSRATVIGLCRDGLLEAVNIARKDSKRCSWRISEQSLEKFTQERGSKVKTAGRAASSGRLIPLAKKDYLAR